MPSARSGPLADYLRARPGVSGLRALLLCFALQQHATAGRAAFTLAALALVALGAAWLARAPRRLALLALVIAVSASTWGRIERAAGSPGDAVSDRDECAEAAGRDLLAGRMPWDWSKPTCNTNGPASALGMALVMAALGSMDEAALAFWLGFLGLCLLGELANRNDSFPLLALLYLVGATAFAHTQDWGLDELFLPWLALPLALPLAVRGRAFALGALLGVALLWRANYAYVAAGLVGWLWPRRPSWRFWGGLAAGGLVATAATLTPFLWLDAAAFGASNPLAKAVSEGTWVHGDRSLAGLAFSGLGLPAAGLAFLRHASGLAGVVLLCRVLNRRDWPHPFWHMAAGGFAAHVLAWAPVEWADYALMYVLPAFLGLAFDPPGQPDRGCT